MTTFDYTFAVRKQINKSSNNNLEFGNMKYGAVGRKVCYGSHRLYVRGLKN